MLRVLAVLALTGVAGCASSPEPPPGEPDMQEADASGDSAAALSDTLSDSACRLEVTVAVLVVNRSSFDLEVYFDGYRAGRTAEGFTRTTYQVPRYRLHRSVTLNILRGGLQLGGPAHIPVEQVFCNDATLLIGARPTQSVFYGDKLYTPQKSEDGGEGEEGEEPSETEDGPGG